MSLEDVGDSVGILVADCASLLPLGRAGDPYGRCIALWMLVSSSSVNIIIFQISEQGWCPPI